MTCCYSLIMPKALFYFFYTKVMFSISIDHNILLGHLRMWVRITGATLNWFCMSYHCYPDYVSFGENWGTFKTVYFAQLSLHKCSVLGCHIFLQLNLKYLPLIHIRHFTTFPFGPLATGSFVIPS